MFRNLLFLIALSITQINCHSLHNRVSKNLLWSDEFNTNGLPNPNIWSYDVGGHGWGNGELQYYTENRMENARVENGYLVIEAKKEEMQGKKYTSARLVTRDKKPILYGRIEVKAKLPQGVGTWPAIWMLGQNIKQVGWPLSGEIDIMEHVGYDPNKVHGSIHTKDYNHIAKTQVTANRMVTDVSGQFHVYALEWRADRIDFFIDAEKFLTFSKEANAQAPQWPFDKEAYLLLNVAIGGFWGGAKGVDESILPQKMLVDYVRVYQLPN
jgi:beta-glucanase (GH16 family)